MLELGRAQGWFGPMKGVYLGVRRRRWSHQARPLTASLSGGKILAGTKLGLVWSDGSPSDFHLWPEEEEKVEEREEERRSPGCVALFADLVFQHTRQAEHWEIGDRNSNTSYGLTEIIIIIFFFFIRPMQPATEASWFFIELFLK